MAPTRDPTHTLPPPRRVRHSWTLAWWLIPLAIALFVHVDSNELGAHAPSAPAERGVEHDAFVVFAFGKVDAEDPQAIHPDVLRAQLSALKDSGAHAIRLRDAKAFMERREPLPARPVLITFEEARRVTLETVDPILDELGLTATAFVNVDGIEQRNIDLVSRRRLKSLADSGRWDLALEGCAQGTAGNAAERFEARRYLRDSGTLERLSGRPVLAITCLRGFGDAQEAAQHWTEVLTRAWLPLGFVAAPPGPNHFDDSPSMLRMIRIGAEARRGDTLVRHLATYAPRREHFVDRFDDTELVGAWQADAAHAQVENGELRLSADARDPRGWATLRWTERWEDARIDVDLAAPPQGQFWIYARRAESGAFLRMGIVDGRAVLQASGADGQTRQLAARQIRPGPVRLSLRSIGSRALAFVDDQPLQERPNEIPAEIARGPIALAVWNPDGTAQASIRRVAVDPLPRRAALIAAEPEDAAFARLRREADDLWAVSPRLFRWRNGRGVEIAQPSRALEIYLHHQRLALVPAVVVDELPQGAAWERFGEDLLRWAERPQFAGFNVVVDRIDTEDVARIRSLQAAVAGTGKHLAVTLRGDAGMLAPEDTEFAWFTQADSASTSYQVVSAAVPQVPG